MGLIKRDRIPPRRNEFYKPYTEEPLSKVYVCVCVSVCVYSKVREDDEEFRGGR